MRILEVIFLIFFFNISFVYSGGSADAVSATSTVNGLMTNIGSCSNCSSGESLITSFPENCVTSSWQKLCERRFRNRQSRFLF